MLAADVARCPGIEADDDWCEGCIDCQRRTDRSTFPLQMWVEPAMRWNITRGAMWCELRIAPEVA